MGIHGFVRRAALAGAVLAASCWIVPGAFAHPHVHVGIGIFVPGVTLRVGNCWHCGYRVGPPVYYRPVYYRPVYAPPGYYVPRRVYYGHGYRVPYPYRLVHRRGYYPHRDWHHHRGHYRHRGGYRHPGGGHHHGHR